MPTPTCHRLGVGVGGGDARASVGGGGARRWQGRRAVSFCRVGGGGVLGMGLGERLWWVVGGRGWCCWRVGRGGRPRRCVGRGGRIGRWCGGRCRGGPGGVLEGVWLPLGKEGQRGGEGDVWAGVGCAIGGVVVGRVGGLWGGGGGGVGVVKSMVVGVGWAWRSGVGGLRVGVVWSVRVSVRTRVSVRMQRSTRACSCDDVMSSPVWIDHRSRGVSVGVMPSGAAVGGRSGGGGWGCGRLDARRVGGRERGGS